MYGKINYRIWPMEWAARRSWLGLLQLLIRELFATGTGFFIDKNWTGREINVEL